MKISNKIVLWDDEDKEHFIEVSEIKSVKVQLESDVHQVGKIPFAGNVREIYMVDCVDAGVRRFPKISHNDDAIINYFLMHCEITVKKY